MIEPIYISRPLRNQAEMADFALSLGLQNILTDMHVTIAYSKDPVDWDAPAFQMDPRDLSVDGGARRIIRLGDEAVVLAFESRALSDRWAQFVLAGALWDFPQYIPHVTLALDPKTPLGGVSAPQSLLRFGGEVREWLDVDRAA